MPCPIPLNRWKTALAPMPALTSPARPLVPALRVQAPAPPRNPSPPALAAARPAAPPTQPRAPAAPAAPTSSAPNPMRELLEQHMGIDAFSLDGSDTVMQDSWSDAPRDPAVRLVVRPVRGDVATLVLRR